MAGDWIKIRTDLHEDQNVGQLSDILGTDDIHTVGLLVRFWSWADKQTADGGGIKLSERRIDALVNKNGFSAALREIGWLAGTEGNLQLPNFERHNGSSAKARALESEAKMMRRKGHKDASKMSDNCRTNNGENVGPEKRREENSTPLTPKREKKEKAKSAEEDPNFEKFWQEYPRKVAKPRAAAAWRKAKDLPEIEALLDIVWDFKQSPKWRTEPEFIPHPATWLNDKRWNDSLPPMAPEKEITGI